MSSKLCLLALVGTLGLIWYCGSSQTAADESAVRPSAAHTYANLSVFILRGPQTFDASHVLTLQEALETGVAVVHETSTVNTLAIENTSDSHEVFVQSGEIVKGGKQDRLIASDLLLPKKSGKISVASNCCERSRWTQRGGESVGKFEKCTDFAVGNPIRLANDAHLQSAVWENVAKTQQALGDNLKAAVTANASPTSLQLALENKAVVENVAAYERALGGLAAKYPDAVGVVIAVNGEVIAADQYGSNELFRKLWPKLLKAASADAIARMPKDGVAMVPSVADVEKFLASTATPEAAPAGQSQPVVFYQTAGNLGALHNRIDNVRLGETVQVMQNTPIALPALDQVQQLRLESLPTSRNPVRFENVDTPALQQPTNIAGVAVNETKAAFQPGASIHKSILKK